MTRERELLAERELVKAWRRYRTGELSTYTSRVGKQLKAENHGIALGLHKALFIMGWTQDELDALYDQSTN